MTLRALALVVLAPLAGCATQTVVTGPTTPTCAYGPAPVAFVVAPAATMKTRVKYVYVRPYAQPTVKMKARGICAIQNADGSLSFTDRCPF